MVRLGKLIGRLFLIAVIVVLGWLIFALAVNWKDEPPSSIAMEFQRYYAEHFPREVTDNGYAYLVGFDVPKDEDPMVWGEARIAWTHELLESRANEDIDGLPGPQDEFFVEPHPGLDLLPNACRLMNQTCIQELMKNQAVQALTLEEGRWVVERYSKLISHNIWVENIYLDVQIPLPAYQHVLASQRLYLADIFLRKEVLEPEVIQQAIEKDLVFWRHVQQDSAILISKMIALAAIQQNFYWTNQVLRHMPKEQQISILSPRHKSPLSQQELSMYRVYVGEWVFGSRFIVGETVGENEWGMEAAVQSWTKFLYQSQATINQMAEHLATLVRHTDQPLENYPEVMASLGTLYPEESYISYLLKPGNAIGRILLALATPAYGDYFVRVSDIEGARRALLLVSQMREQNIPVAEARTYILQSTIKNPYTNQSFDWDDEEQAVVFMGLQKGNRARHVFIY